MSLNDRIDLRTRIASIVTQMDNNPCCDGLIHAVEPSDWSLEVADAVMDAVYPHLGDCYEDGYQHGREYERQVYESNRGLILRFLRLSRK